MELDVLIKALVARIALDQEAGDPDGFVAGMSEALRIASKALGEAAGPPDGLKVAIWTDSVREPVWSAIYEGSEQVRAGFDRAIAQICLLWGAGADGMTIELTRGVDE